MKQETYRRIVSGQDQRLYARVLRILLGLLSALYGLAVCIRNNLYNRGVLRSYSVDVPVICVGNLTAGGTGKTPLVVWLCNYLAGIGIKCAILTRGYKTDPGQMTDEPALLARTCEGTAVVVNPDRVEGAKKAISQHGAKLLIMDDGFQHRRLKRNLDIVTIDATCPFGYGKILPAGLLREPVSSLARAGVVVITRTDQADDETLTLLEQRIRTCSPDISITKTAHKPGSAFSFPDREISLDTLRQEKIFAFCGIGNPDAFFDSLTQHGMTLCGKQTFDDHHEYTIADMDKILSQAKACGATMILCTQKDWVKSAGLGAEAEHIVFAYLAIELDFIEGFDKISQLLDTLLTDYQLGRTQ